MINYIFQTSVLIMKCIELTWLCKHIKKIRSSQPAILYWNEWSTSLSLWVWLRLNRFQEPYTQPAFTCLKLSIETLKKGVKYVPSICDGAFLWIYLSTLHFRNISSIIDLRLGYIWVSENVDIFKVKLKWSNSSRLLQRIALLVFELT